MSFAASSTEGVVDAAMDIIQEKFLRGIKRIKNPKLKK
jgi:hypothetical protein